MKRYLFVLALLLIPFSVNAASGSLICNKDTAIINDTISCELEITSNDEVKEIKGNIDYNEASFNLIKLESLNNWVSSSNANIDLKNENNNVTGVYKVARLTFKVKDTPIYGNNNIKISDTNLTNSPSDTIKILSGNNKLSKLNIQGLSFSFDSSKTDYKLTINQSSITINAVLQDERASFVEGYGPRDVKLNYGSNVVKVIVKSESGKTNIYTLNITRKDNRSTDNYLSSLTLSTGELSPAFNKEKTVYDVNVPTNVDSITINALLSSDAASFKDGYGPRKINLNLGDNQILLTVKAESGIARTYTINVTRASQNSNNYLKDLTLSSGNINFEKEKMEYHVNIANEITDVTVDAVAVDEKAIVTITGGKNLQIGENIVEIKVEAENKVIRTYKIFLNRLEDGDELSNNNNVKNIYVENYGLNFKSDIFSYTLKIGNEKKLNIKVTPDVDSTVIQILGNENLKNGSKIEIIAVSENDDSKTYTINIEKESKVLYIILGIIVLAILVVIIFLIINRKKIFNKDTKVLDDKLLLNKEKNERIVIEQKTRVYDPLIKEDITFEDK